jgi:hypothetical protein
MIMASDSPPQEILDNNTTTPLTRFPTEILLSIASYLPPVSLARLACTCKRLRDIVCHDESLWRRQLQDQVHYPLPRYFPGDKTCKEVYQDFHYFWFLTRQQLWFTDGGLGALLIATYDADANCIRGYGLNVADGFDRSRRRTVWEKNRLVTIWTFQPIIMRTLERFCLTDPSSLTRRTPAKGDFQYGIPAHRLPPEVHRLSYKRFMLAKNLPTEEIDPATLVWPPFTIPSRGRVRRLPPGDHQVKMTSRAYMARSMSKKSESAFRLMTRSVHSLGARPQILRGNFGTATRPFRSTFAALPAECAPTPLKPFSGVWVGDYDYGDHGVQFVAFLQLDEFVLPDLAREAWQSCRWINSTGDANQTKYTGSLVGVKLTGDTWVPRGEYAFIIPSTDRVLRIADEAIFEGVPVVGGLGHHADVGFTNGNDSSMASARQVTVY